MDDQQQLNPTIVTQGERKEVHRRGEAAAVATREGVLGRLVGVSTNEVISKNQGGLHVEEPTKPAMHRLAEVLTVAFLVNKGGLE